MKKHDVVAIIGIVAVCAAGYLAYPAIQQRLDPHGPLLAACEAAIKDRLKAPSTYRRAEKPIFTVEEVTPEEAMPTIPEEAESESLREAREAMRSLYRQTGAFRHTAVIKYDSANSFGTPLRGLDLCESYTTSKDTPGQKDVRPGSVLINGKTTTDWAIEGIRSLSQ